MPRRPNKTRQLTANDEVLFILMPFDISLTGTCESWNNIYGNLDLVTQLTNYQGLCAPFALL